MSNSFREFLRAVTPNRQEATHILFQMLLITALFSNAIPFAEAAAGKPHDLPHMSPDTVGQAKPHAEGNSLNPETPLEITQTPETKSAVTIVFERIFQALAIASNIALQLSPMRVILEIRRYKDTRGSDGLPYFMIFCVATQWVFYASYSIFVTGNANLQMIIFGNVMGVILGFFYVWSFQRNCNDQVRANKMKIIYRIAFILSLIEIVAVAVVSRETGMFILGLVGSILSVGCTAAPLTELSVVLKTRDTSTWPTDFIYVNSVGLLVWLICGILLKDNWVIIPNSIGLGICLFQLSLIVVFGADPSIRKKRIRRDELTFHVIDETAPIVPETYMKKNAGGKAVLSYEPLGEDNAPHVKGGSARVMW